MMLLRNAVQSYDWGPIDGLVPLVGAAPSGGHQAELWVGTHPRGPSVVVGGPSDGAPLAEALGEPLPFLLKVLAIGQALSVQAHPSSAQAADGFAREQAAGIPLGAPQRNYRDDQPKPEALVAIVPTWVLCGFRDPMAAAELVDDLQVPALDPLVGALRSGRPDALGDALRWLLHLGAGEREEVAGEAEAAAAEAVDGVEDRVDPRWWVVRLAAEHPSDPTCLVPLLLELLRLDPGEAVHLPAGNLHAYLEGAGVEIMQASDNVLRGGLTDKHVDVDELLSVLRLEAGVPARPTVTDLGAGRRAYDCGEVAFGLVRVHAAAGDPAVAIEPTAASLLLAVGGPVTVTGADGARIVLDHGAAAYASAADGSLAVEGPGTLWWATTGEALPR